MLDIPTSTVEHLRCRECEYRIDNEISVNEENINLLYFKVEYDSLTVFISYEFDLISVFIVLFIIYMNKLRYFEYQM